jgi:hypothetical protein
MSHSLRQHQEEVDSQLLVVKSQTGILTPGPSFAHNLGCRCSNDACEAILGICTSRPFHWYKERTNARRFDPSNHLLSFWESQRLHFPTFGSVSCIFTLSPKVGLRQQRPMLFIRNCCDDLFSLSIAYFSLSMGRNSHIQIMSWNSLHWMQKWL